MKKGKRIGLVTWFLGANYGSTLQSYALTHELERQGHKVTLLRYFKYPLSLKFIKVNTFTKFGIKRPRALADCPFPVKRKRFLDFFRKEFRTYLPNDPIRYALFLKRTDVFMSGSDQLWNCYDHFRGFEFLDFAKNNKKVSYATSIGTSDIPSEFHEKVRSYLSEYDSISVREKTGAQALERITGRKDIRVVLDPTFLLDRKDWGIFAEGAGKDFNLPDKYIFCYLLRKGTDFSGIIEKIKKQTGIGKVMLFPSNENPLLDVAGTTRIENAGPREFIKALLNATYVVTDSFHGSALSINLGKQFLNLKRFDDADPASQNSRLYDLPALFGLSPRFYEGSLPEPIDYGIVGERLEELRKDSKDYLKSILA